MGHLLLPLLVLSFQDHLNGLGLLLLQEPHILDMHVVEFLTVKLQRPALWLRFDLQRSRGFLIAAVHRRPVVRPVVVLAGEPTLAHHLER